MAKNYVIIKGRVVRMEDSTFNKFGKHIGATRNQPAAKSTPIELLKFPKPVTPRVEPAKVEMPRVLRKKPVVKQPEPVAEVPKAEEVTNVEELKAEEPKAVEVKKTSRKKSTK